jgi:hypothetical protein
MAESKFLKWQDHDGDGLIEVCDDVADVKANICLNCSPNPAAIKIDWKKKTIDTPYMDERTCEYKVTVVTPYTTMVPSELLEDEAPEEEISSALQARFQEFVDDVIDSLLNYYDKDSTGPSQDLIREALKFEKYYLDSRPNSHLKLLYSVPFDVLFGIGPDQEEDAQEPEEPGEITLTYGAADLNTKMIRIRKGLNLYGRFLKVYRAIEGGNLYFKEDNRLFNLESYGDSALWSDSIMSNLLDHLATWLETKGFDIPGHNGGFLGITEAFGNKDTVTKLEFKFNNYKLKHLKVWSESCGEKPKHYGVRKLRALRNTGAWKDVTAVAYFTKLYEMDSALSARVQIPWEDFVIKYTYPEVYSTLRIDDEEVERTAASCLADALAQEGKELGQDILDKAFDLGDAIAYKFRKSICLTDTQKAREREAATGRRNDPSIDSTKSITAMATMQAMKELDESDQVFRQLCSSVLASMLKFGPAKKKADLMWEFGFERIKACGLFDLLLDAINCLMGGLTFEEAVASMVKSALKAMSIENFGELFIGLPDEKQLELEALVKKKLESGDIFPPNSTNQKISNIAASGTSFSRPWEIQSVIDQERNNRREGAYEGAVTPPSAYGPEAAAAATAQRRTLAKQFDVAGSAESELDPSIIMEAYMMALIEVYSDNLLSLIDELNRFPGAQIISSIITALDCPVPPLFNPDLLSFIKDIELPFCRDLGEIRSIRMENPFRWIPDIKDILKSLEIAIREAINQLIFYIVMRLMVKICEIIGDAICKALEMGGELAMALPSVLQGSTTFSDVIRDSICGPDASQKQVEDTIVDVVASLGAGGAALANRDKVLQFTEDLSSSLTKEELIGGILGEPSQTMMDVGMQLLNYEYPELGEAMSTPQAFGNFVGNVGNLMPAEFRQQLRDALNADPMSNALPANPTLCATQEQLDNFNDLRCTLLEGRASQAQCAQMLSDSRGDLRDDLESLGDLLQGGVSNYIADNMPPIVSKPGCDDGLFPHMPEPLMSAGGNVLKNDLEMLKVDFAKDMLGNGGLFAGDADWGFMNMVLSDTEGNPLTAHWRKAYNNNDYVHFATNVANGGNAAVGFWAGLFGKDVGFSGQHGQFPTYVGSWLMRQFLVAGESTATPPVTANGAAMTLEYAKDLSGASFNSSNTIRYQQMYYKNFDELGFDDLFGSVDLFMLPDFGYNTTYDVNPEFEQVVITRLPRKSTPDMILRYRDNGAGYRESVRRDDLKNDWPYSWGFNIQFFLSDIAEIQEEYEYQVRELSPEEMGEYSIGDPSDLGVTATATRGTGEYANRFDDNVRIKIEEVTNQKAKVERPESALMSDDPFLIDALIPPPWLASVPIVGWAIAGLFGIINIVFSGLAAVGGALAGTPEDESIISERRYEFLTVDDGLDDIDLTLYPKFGACFQNVREYMPQVSLLSEMVENSTSETSALDLSEADAKIQHDTHMNTLFKLFAKEIGENTSAWKYGARFDSLKPEDADYLIPEGYPGAGQLYSDAKPIWDDERGEYREAENDDMLMGVSRDQYRRGENARIIYLDPNKYGGSYMRPGVYVKPMKYDGWLGLVNALFPEYTPCKPHNADIVDFGEIQERITELYSKIPEDTRLKSDPECAVEVPFNRILDRPAKAGLAGIIEAAIRIYATVGFFKAIATFSKIMPKFPDNYSSLYSSFIVEVMEESFKDAQAGFWEWFNPFKDEEFWYAFLEQSVQYYAWRVDEGEIEPPISVLDALKRLNDVQENYNFPWYYDLMYARATREADPLQSLKGYRGDKNLETVKINEEDAKLILKELVNEQLTMMGERLVTNLQAQGFNPDIYDLDYWLFSNLCDGGEALSFGGPEFVEQVSALPEEPGAIAYSPGSQFRIAIANDPDSPGIGEEYVGYFHVHEDEDGEIIYMAGETHSEDPHDVLRPIANLIKVGTIHTSEGTATDDYGSFTVPTTEWIGIGDVADYGTSSGDGTNPFRIEKYISVDGSKYAPLDAITLMLEAHSPETLISEAYPGTMVEVKSEPVDEYDTAKVVGIEGEFGVRYGIAFSYNNGATPVEITTVEIDALDLPIEAMAPFEPDSHQLLCLLKMLKKDQKYKLLARYIFPLPKVISTLAIYNDLGFVSSISEVTVGNGDFKKPVNLQNHRSTPALLRGASVNSKGEGEGDANAMFANENVMKKPGALGYVGTSYEDQEIPNPWRPDDTIMAPRETFSEFFQSGNEGWQSYHDRNKGFGDPGVKEWDDWDRVLLRNSKSRIKKIFKSYYNSRNFTPGDDLGVSAGALWIKNMKEKIIPSPGRGILTWWQRGRIRSNPYNAKGKLCDKND